MHPAATLFLDVCVQSQLWPEGVWRLVSGAQALDIARLFAIAAAFGVRQGGVVCRHVSASAEPVCGAPVHCRSAESANARPVGCLSTLPMQVWAADVESNSVMTLDRAHAVYVDSGCGLAPDGDPCRARAFEHLTAGVRDAVVFGAGVEHGVDRVVDGLLRRRIRTHVALDAVGTADEILAQTIAAAWKRRGVDGITVETLERMLKAS